MNYRRGLYQRAAAAFLCALMLPVPCYATELMASSQASAGPVSSADVPKLFLADASILSQETTPILSQAGAPFLPRADTPVSAQADAALVAQQPAPLASQASVSGDSFSAHYTALTKEVLLTGIELERYSLNYRLRSCQIPLANKLIFFGTQEAGASCALGFEITAVQQFGRGRRRVLSISPKTLVNGLQALEVGSIIAASGCAYEIGANAWRYARGRKEGYDTVAANKYVASHLQRMDQLVAERKALIDANPSQPGHDRAVIEGRILDLMRGAFATEYSHFSANTSSFALAQNIFYFMNGAFNVLGAIGSQCAFRGINNPRLNGTANVIFTVSGAIATASPILCTAAFLGQRKYMYLSQMRKLGGAERDLGEIAKQRALLAEASSDPGKLMPSFPATNRLALYTESNNLFVQQLESETKTRQVLNKVALQNSIMGPVIGGLLMTQGILGTHGYYSYFRQPRVNFDLAYKGAICGTVGAAQAVFGNAAWLIASLAYEHHLYKQKKMPEQLIRQRLEHLDEVEKIIRAI